MLKEIYSLLGEADIVIHYNGSNFDIPTLNREFIQDQNTPPAPFAEVDLLKTCRNRFRFLSNKLDYVARFLGDDGKMSHKGMELWKGCMVNDLASWKIMERYNKRDVVVLERLYTKLLPWIQPHPNLALHNDDNDEGIRKCPNCGGSRLQSRGKALTPTRVYGRYQCQDCGKWSRGRVNEAQLANVQVGVK